jgi:hypothetical protein
MADDEAFAESSRLRHVAGRIIGLLIVVSAIVVGLYVLRLYTTYTLAPTTLTCEPTWSVSRRT